MVRFHTRAGRATGQDARWPRRRGRDAAVFRPPRFLRANAPPSPLPSLRLLATRRCAAALCLAESGRMASERLKSMLANQRAADGGMDLNALRSELADACTVVVTVRLLRAALPCLRRCFCRR